MNRFLKIILVVLVDVLPGCSSDQPKGHFSLDKNGDQAALSLAIKVLPAVLRACPGLDIYAGDLSSATVSTSNMRGYEGGVSIMFRVADQPQLLPRPLNVYSQSNNCYIDVSMDGSSMYIGKKACHSICDGVWKENDQGSMGRSFSM